MRHYPPSVAPPRAVDGLVDEWSTLAATVEGEVSVQLRSLDGPLASRLADREHYAASALKLAVLVAALAEVAAGRLSAGQPVAIRSDFPSALGGRYTMRQADDQDDATWARLGERLPLSTLLERMVVDSSNIATNAVVELVTAGAVRRVLADARVSGSAVRHLIGDERAMAAGILNTTTAGGLARTMTALAGGRLLPPQATRQALALLAKRTHRAMIPAGLPDEVWSAGKPAWTATVDHDVALVRPDSAPDYVLAVCTTTGPGATAQRLVARLSAVTWEYWTTWHTP